MLAIAHHTWRRYRWYLIGGMLCVALVGVGIYMAARPQPVVQPTISSETRTSRPAQPRVLTSRMLIMGNSFWGRYTNDWAMAHPLKQTYPFSRLNEFHRDQYDAWISGLECPTVPGLSISSAQMDETLAFNCDPSYLAEAAKWFTAFTLANNHTDNQGTDGFTTTRQQLDAHHIQYFGHYDPRVTDDVCDVIRVPATVALDDQKTRPGAFPVAMCGYHGVFRIPDEAAIAQMKVYGEYMPVLAFPHMGEEYKAAPDELKTKLYRSMIDAGADAVLGDHPHWVQTTESYKGHLIVYSMGNFMFDQQKSVEVTRSAAIRLTLTIKGVENKQLARWLAIADHCSGYHDTCLETIRAEKLVKLPFTMQFGVIGTDDGGKITKPATEQQTASILDRLQWSRTMSQLQSPYSSL